MADKVAMQQRFQTFAEHIGIKKNAIGLQLGRDRDYVRKFTGKPSVATRQLFQQVFPSLNLDWIITGQGTMILPGMEDKAKEICPLTSVQQKLVEENRKLRDKVKVLEQKIEELQKSSPFHNEKDLL